MIPKKLTMNAFGTYKQETVINFEDLMEHQLFLITGPTGSGKTTIFDALVYALYGEASGSSRRGDELKSQFATDEDLAFVSLNFEADGKEYDIHRIPSQRGPGKGKSKSTRKYNAEVRFTTPDMDYTKIGEANTAIQDVIGLSADQFKQIVMLPQGEFKRLLEAGSREKQVIFRKIFNTELLQAFEEKLKEKAAHGKKESDQLRKSLDDSTLELMTYVKNEEEKLLLQAHIDKEQYGEIASWAKLLTDTLSKQQVSLRDQINALGKIISQYTENRRLILTQQQLLERQKLLKGQSAEIDKLKQGLAEYRDTLNLYQTKQAIQQLTSKREVQTQANVATDAEIQELEKVIANNKIVLKKWQDDYDSVPQLRQEVKDLEEEQAKWQEYQAVMQEVDELVVKIKDNEHNQLTLQQQLSDLEKKRIENEQQIMLLDTVTSQLDDFKMALNNTNQAQLLLNTKQQQLGKLSKIEIQLTAVKEKHQKEYADWQAQKKLVGQIEEIYQRHLAGHLAMGLEDDMACPVCGSKEHPDLATLATQEVSKEELAEERQKNDNLFESVTALATELKSLQIQMTALRQEMNWEEQSTKELAESLDQQQSHLNTQQEEIQTQINNIHQQQAKQTKLLQVIDQQKVKISALVTEQASLVAVLENLNGQHKSKREKSSILISALNFESAIAVTQKLQQLTQKITEIESHYQQLSTQQNQLDKQLSVLNERLQGTQKQLAVTNEEIVSQSVELDQALAESQLTIEQLTAIHESQEDWLAIDQQIQQFDKQQYTVNTQLTDNKEQLVRHEVSRNEAEYSQAIQIIEDKQETLQQERDGLLATTSALQQTQQRFNATVDNYKEQTRVFGELRTLSEIANGTMTGSVRVSFERFVLGKYLAEIIEMANLRFNKMTAGRYEFRHAKDEQKGAGAKGLDLSVYDYFAGNERSVQSLSGGESFKASLALALGLSDVIQSYAGGIEVNTLFIDEGFGTLDQESLQQAIQTLMQLQEESGRLIGIISHVEELKQQIPVHLEITTTDEGGSSCHFTGIY